MKGLILVYAITILGSLGALWTPVIGLFVYVGLAVLRPQFIWGFAGDFENISLVVGIATLVGWVLHGCGSLKIGRGKGIVALLGVFSVLSIASGLQARDSSLSYDALISMAKFVMPFMIGVTLLDSEKKTRTMMWVIVLAQGYVGFEMNLAYLKGYNIAGDGFGGMDNNCFGVSLVSTIGPALALALSTKKWSERMVATVAAALIMHTTLLTYSRGAMVGLLIVGATAFVIMPKRPKYIAALIVISLLAVRFVGPQLEARYATAFADEADRDESAESRIDLWADCLRIAEQHPFLGIGPGNFQVVAEDLGWAPGKQAHSTWMQTMAENGFPGFLVLFLFFVLPIFQLWPIARAKLSDANRYQVGVATGIIMCVVGFIVTGQFVSLAGLEIPYYAVMIGIGLLNQKLAVPVADLPAASTVRSGPRSRLGVAPPLRVVPPLQRP